MAGVKVVRDGEFIGVMAPDAYTAQQAVKAIVGEVGCAAAAGQ